MGLKAGLAATALLLAIPFVLAPTDRSGVDLTITFLSLSVFGVAGLVASIKRPDSWIGPLMVGYALVSYAAALGSSSNFTLFVMGAWASALPIAVIAHLVLTYPSGRLRNVAERFVIVALYATCLLEGIVDSGYEGLYRISLVRGVLIVVVWTLFAMFVRRVWNSGDRPAIPLLPVLGSAALLVGLIVSFDVLDFVRLHNAAEADFYRAVTIARLSLTLLVLGLMVHRFVRASRPTRRSMAPTWISAAVLVLITVLSWRAIGHASEVEVGDIVKVSGSAAALIPAAYLWGLLRLSLVRGTVGKLVIELGASPVGGGLREALARALRDRSLELAFWLPDSHTYVDSEGRFVELPGHGSKRAVTLLEREGEPLAALIHDPALSNEREVVEAAAAAAGLALQNERLHAEVRVQLDEVRASRARIVDAADESRRRVERDLHDGAQQRLVTLSLALRAARDQLGEASPAVAATLAEAAAELKLAITELRELARGIHPAILTEEGLGPALRSLAERAPLPVEVVAAPADRLPAAVEASAYFVVAEALANAGKYSGASKVTIEVDQRDGTLFVTVADDGIGEADPSNGSGLRGLADRVTALDGRFQVESPPHGGTRLVAALPCE
jgi:signal transduction histidine kinase